MRLSGTRFTSLVAMVLLGCLVALVGCGGDDPTGPGTPWVGDWELLTENGVAPVGYMSTLAIQTGTFTSTYEDASQSCSWSGTLTATATQITWSFVSATGPPCDIAVGTMRTSTWMLSGDGDTLTLDFTGTAGGTLQVWSRT